MLRGMLSMLRVRWVVVLGMVTVAAAAGAEQGGLQMARLGRCTLESGQVIEDCQVGYRTFGKMDAARANVVVTGSWLNGRSEDLKVLFGAAHRAPQLVDTSRFFGVAFDAFGDGVSSSPSNSVRQHGAAFPVFTIADIVRAQYRVLTEVLHVQHVHAAVGLSMGGHQVFAWAVLYPRFVDKAVPIVGSPQVTNFDRLSKQIIIDAIEADPAYEHGHYTREPQLKLANEVGYMIVATPQYRNAEAKRAGYPEWLGKIEAPSKQDANDRVWQSKAILLHDLLGGRPIDEVARANPVKFYVISALEDRMVTPAPALEWAKAAGAPSYVSPGACAHLILSCDADEVSRRVEGFLAQ